VPEEVLEALTELEHADAEIAAALGDLDGLSAEVDSIRAKGADVQAFHARLPAERERLDAELERARVEALAAQEAMAEAEVAAHTAEPARAREAERFLVRARDRVSMAERRAAAAASARGHLENAVAEMQREGDELDARARKLAGELAGRSQVAGDAGREPAAGLAGLEAWSEVARAALFVARGQLASQREGVVRQANEIGALALGEPLTSASAAVVTRRVRRSLRGARAES
jgi:hypothetical protein